MIWLHMFRYKQRLIDPNYFTFIISSKLNDVIVKFSTLCVPLFLFIAGYGAAIKVEKDNFSLKNVVKKLYTKLWIVFVIFIPICILFNKINFDLKEFILNLTGFYYSYCGEWWFFGLYIELNIMIFLLNKLKLLNNDKKLIFFSILFMFFGYSMKFFLNNNIMNNVLVNNIYMLLIKQPIFFVGYLFYKNNIFSYFIKWKSKTYLLLLSCLGVFTNIPETFYLIIAVPAFIYSFCRLLTIGKFYKIFEFLGKNSTYMWLTHSILLYKLIQNVIYYYHYTLICFFILLIIDIVIAIMLNKIEVIINNIKNRFYRRVEIENIISK